MRPYEHDRLRAGVTDGQLSNELNFADRPKPKKSPGNLEKHGLGEALMSRVGRPLSTGREGGATDVSRLGAHLAWFGQPIPCTSIVRNFGWSLDRFDRAKMELARLLPGSGLALYESAEELIEIDSLPDALGESANYSASSVVRDAIALKGLSPDEAQILRNLLENPVSIKEASPEARVFIRSLMCVELVQELGRKIEVTDAVRSVFNAGQLPERSTPVR